MEHNRKKRLVDIRSRFWRVGGSFPSIVICFMIAFLVGILYYNSLDNQFTNWDDGMIYQNSTIRDWSWTGIKRIFTYVKANTYQPVRMLSYAIDYRLWNLNPVGYRITNIFFYILTCTMVFFTLRELSKTLRDKADPSTHQRVALFGSLLFAAHPVHVEAVTWLAARKEVLQGFFFFLGFYLYLRGREEAGRRRILFLSLVLFSILLATLSKPSAVVFPGVLLIYEISLKRNRWVEFLRRRWIFFLLSTVISFVFVFILMKVMLEAGGVKPYHGGSFLSNLLFTFHIFLYNLKLLVFTINYSAAYTIPVPNSILGLRTLLFITITLLLFGLSLWSLKRTKVLFFSFFFFFITLLPYLNLIPISTVLADRYLFIASFSYCFLLGISFELFHGIQKKGFSKDFFKVLSVALFLFVLFGYSLMTVHQNRIWENSYTLWADAVEKSPDSNTANALMGVVYMDLGMDEKAVGYLEKAVQILPYDYQSRNNLGIVYGRSGQPEKALKEYLTAIWLNPEGDSAKWNLAVFYHQQREYKKSEEVFKYMLGRSPGDPKLHFRLGLVYKDMGRYGEAVSELLRSMELAPEIINPYEELGNLYLSKMGDVEKAKFYYKKGIKAAPRAIDRIEQLRWMIQDLER